MYLGDFKLNDGVVAVTFTTVGSDGAPAALSGGSAIIRNLSNNSTSEGVSLETNINSVTGLNRISVNLADNLALRAAGHEFSIELSAGTVGGKSVAGYVIAQFSIQKRPQLMADGGHDFQLVNVSSLKRVDAGVEYMNQNVINDIAAESANTVWDEARSDHVGAGTFGEAIKNLLAVGIFGECSGTSSDSEISTAGIGSGVINSYLVFISGSLAGLSRRIVNVTGGTIIHVSPAFPQAPNSGDKFVILGRAG